MFFLVPSIPCYQLPRGLLGDLHCFFLFPVFSAINYPGVCGVTYSVFSCSKYSVLSATQGLWGDLQCFFLFPVFGAISYPGVCGVSRSIKGIKLGILLKVRYITEKKRSKYMSRIVRKPVFGVSDQVRHKPGCTATEDC